MVFKNLRRGWEQAAEKVVEVTSLPRALKRLHIFNGLAARLKSGPSQNLPQSYFFHCLWEAAPLQSPEAGRFFASG
jgi:hypothetical protein